MKAWLGEHWAPALLLLAGFATRFAVVAHPSDVVWDEQHFGRMTSSYLQGKFWFDVHPPLGVLIVMVPLKLAGADPGTFDFQCGHPYPGGYPYVAARLVTSLIGALFPWLIYLLARALALSKGTAFIAGSLVLLETALLAESHFALIDVFVHFFGAAGILMFLRHRKALPKSRGWWGYLAGAGMFAACSLSVKWTGAGALGVIALIAAFDAFRSRDVRGFLIRGGLVTGVAVAVYMGVFAIHFKLLPKSGTGDAFMSERFKATLVGTTESKQADLKPLGFLGKFTELNRRIWITNTTQKLEHGESSKFWKWPLGLGRVWFWGTTAPLKSIYMLPNPAVWWFGTLSVLAALLYPILRRTQWRGWKATDLRSSEKRFALGVLLAIYLVNYLPFFAISRSMFIYHYFTSMVASVLVGALLWFEIIPAAEGWTPLDGPKLNRPALFLIAVAVGVFVFLTPVAYGYAPRFEWPLRTFFAL